MALGVHQKVSHDISMAFGKGLQGLKVEAIGDQGKARKGLWGRTVMETVLLGLVTVAVAALPVVVTRVPAPESLLLLQELLHDWCTPSVCFGVLIVGVLVVTLGGAAPGTPEQNHQKFAESYLTQSPVSAAQFDPLRMPDIFFSPDAARTHALSPSFRAPQPPSVMVPVYYPAFAPPSPHPPFSPHPEKDPEFLHRQFSPRAREWFSPKLDDRYVSRGQDRYLPQAGDRYIPQAGDRYIPQAEERYAPQAEEQYIPQVEERYVPEVEERYEPEDHDRFEVDEEDNYEPEEELSYGAHMESGARSGPQVEARYEHVESDREEEVEARYINSEADDEGEAEPEPEVQSESEAEVEHYSHQAHVQQQQQQQQLPLPSETVDSRKPISPPHSPVAPPAVVAAQVPQRPSYHASSTSAPDVETPSSLLTRRRPLTVPTPVTIQQAPPAPPPPASEPVASSPSEPPPPEPKPSVRKELLETSEAPNLSPRTPPKHPHSRRTTSRTYGEFVRRTIDCPLPSLSTRPKAGTSPIGVLPKVLSSPSPRTEVGEPTLDEKLARMKARRYSTGGMAVPVPASPALEANKRPREVRVVDDENLDDKQLTEDDDVDQRVEAFLKNFREQIRLQRQESLQRHRRTEPKL